MKRIFRINLLLLSLCLSFKAVAAADWYPLFSLGYGITHVTTQQRVRLANTPAPGQTNLYTGDSTLYGAALFGIAIERQLNLSLCHLIPVIGIEFDYMRNHAVTGNIAPLVNVAPDFDQLKYTYNIHTYLLQGTAKLVKPSLIFQLDAYLQAGIGIAANELSQYREYASRSSSAAPMLAPFTNNTTVNAAASMVAGIRKVYGHQAQVSLDYRFYYTGDGQLHKSAVQQTSSVIRLSPIFYHFLVLSIGSGD